MAVALYNNTHEKITLKRGTIVAKVAATNVIPPMLAPASGMSQNVPNVGDGLQGNGSEDGYIPSDGRYVPDQLPKPKPTQERLDKLFSKFDLIGISEWSEYDQN